MMKMNNPVRPLRNSQEALDAARSAFEFARGEFRSTEDDFLQVLNELWTTDRSRLRNLATLEGLRMQLMESFNGIYRQTVNNLVEALLASIGEPPSDRTDDHSPDGHSAE